MKQKQIDLSALYSPLTDAAEDNKQKAKQELKKALNCHFLLSQTGNQYYPLKGIAMQGVVNATLSYKGATQDQLHEQCKKIMERR